MTEMTVPIAIVNQRTPVFFSQELYFLRPNASNLFTFYIKKYFTVLYKWDLLLAMSGSDTPGFLFNFEEHDFFK